MWLKLTNVFQVSYLLEIIFETLWTNIFDHAYIVFLAEPSTISCSVNAGFAEADYQCKRLAAATKQSY